MTVRARQRGLAQFRKLVDDFGVGVVEGRARSARLTAPSADLVQDPDALREALEELRTHQEELSVADEEMRVQLEELSMSNGRIHTERDRYRELFDVAPDAYFVTDRMGAIRDVNAAGAAMLGIETRFLLGKPLAAVVDAADTRMLRDAVSTLRNSPSAEIEIRFKPRGGELRWYAVKGVSVEQNTALLWIARDVHAYRERTDSLTTTNGELGVDAVVRTRQLERANKDKNELLERERDLRARLEDEQRAKDRFLAVLSRDLRAPLNAVLGWTQLLRREKLDESARDRGLATIERNAHAQLRLLEELRDISRLGVDHAQVERGPVELRALATGVVAAAAAEAAVRKVEIRVALGDEDLLVAGDRSRLERVVSNLVSNALKFTPTAGTITLTLDHDGATVRLVVADNGRGIKPERLPHVFDAFRGSSGETATTYDGLGHGLGLYVARGIVLMHGGEVVAESAGPGAGARFVVSLPLANASKARANVATRAGKAPQAPLARGRREGLEGLRVLVVDDDDDARELMAAILRHHGATVDVAANVSAAVQAFAIAQPDVLVSDVVMPGRSGLELARELRARPTTTASMIAVSGFTSPDEVERALDAGFDMHVAKPVDPEDLVRAVRDAALLRVH
jgi:PAS domain S-box-containing protein